MTNYYHDCSDAEQLHARRVGEASTARPQQPAASSDAAHTVAEIDQQIERVCWLMRREPMLEREVQPWAGA
jgi:hypothetical protein